MKRRHIFLFLTAILLVTACGPGNGRYGRLLAEAEWMNRNDSLFTTDSAMKRLVRHYDHWWYSRNTRMRAYYMLGCAYRDMGSAPRALENYQQAVSLADTTRADCDLNTLMRIHSQMSLIFLQQRLPEQEQQELEAAERLAWQIGDTLSALIFEGYACNLLCNHRAYKECIARSLQLHSQYVKYGYSDNAPLSYIYCIRSYLALKDYVKVKKYLSLYETCPFFKDSPQKVAGGLSPLYIYKGQYFLGIEDADSAEYYFRKSLPYDTKLLSYKGLFQAYKLKHNADSVLKYTQLYSDAKEQDFDNARAQATIQTKTLYDYGIEQKIAREKTKENSLLIIVLITTLFVSFIIVTYLLYRRWKKKQEIIELFRKYQIALQELNETEEELLSARESQTTDKNLIADYHNKIGMQETRIAQLEETIRRTNQKGKDFCLKETAIVMRFENVRLRGKDKDISPKDWEELRETIEKLYPTFSGQMNARQQLNENEYNVCLLSVAGFEPSDIDNLMQKSASFASMTRKRLCEKVFGFKGKPGDFDRLLRRLYS